MPLEPLEPPRYPSFGQVKLRDRHFSFRSHPRRETLSPRKSDPAGDRMHVTRLSKTFESAYARRRADARENGVTRRE